MFHESQQIGLYTLIRKLGEGGFGEVWLAENRNHSPSERVAIKLPRNDQIDLQTVKDEIFNWILSGKHKNILPIIECETFGNQIAIISEFAPDGSLQNLINRKSALSTADAVEITDGILNGLTHLHNRKIIHRDLKPDNVLFQGRVPRLTDFGISRVMPLGSRSQTISGTLSYMAPEAFDGKRNEQTDIWAVGVILYQLLTGNLPFPQKELVQLVGALATKDPEPLPDHIPTGLQHIVKKSLSKDLSERYQTAAQMRDDLNSFRTTHANFSAPLPTQASIPVNTAETIDSHSVSTQVSPQLTDKPQAFTLPKQPPQKTKTNLIYFGIAASVLALFAIAGTIYFLTKKPKETNDSGVAQSSPVATVSPKTNQAPPGFIPFRKGDKFGFSDQNKKILIEPKYEAVLPFSDDLAAAQLNGKWGFIDKTGKVIVSPKYENAYSFSEGLAMVNSNGQHGFIDKTGKEVISRKYQDAKDFSEGLAAVQSDNKWGFIDKTGKEIIPIKYDGAYKFSEGLADAELNDKYGFIDKTGKEIIPFKFDNSGSFSEGLVSVKLNNKWGFIDKTGNEVIPIKYDYAFSFSEGLAGVTLNGQSGYVDASGNEVLFNKYDNVLMFSEDLAAVELKGKWGFIDKTGKEIILFKYNETNEFSEGIAIVKLNDIWIYIDKNGTEYYEP